MSSPPLFLGVDGGGSKTQFVLADGDGGVIATHAGPSSYHLEIGMDSLRRVLGDGLVALFRQAGTEAAAVTYAFFGLPAHGEDSAAQAELDAMPEALLGHRRYRCGNDMVCAWAGSLAGEDGINIVAGTGSIGYGERRGISARAGGWGEIFGDEGSAYWIAVKGLNAFTRMSDGRLPRGRLYTAFRGALGVTDDLELCGKVMNSPMRGRIAALSQVVAAAAQGGDRDALEIFDDAAREMAAVVEAVRQALCYQPGESVPLSYSGGVFKAAALILAPLERHLAGYGAGFSLRPPRLAPGAGAVIYAAKLAAQPLSTAALAWLASSLPDTERG
jgi:N-acetylglucosamine kinase-like BadF-type ATPase